MAQFLVAWNEIYEFREVIEAESELEAKQIALEMDEDDRRRGEFVDVWGSVDVIEVEVE